MTALDWLLFALLLAMGGELVAMLLAVAVSTFREERDWREWMRRR